MRSLFWICTCLCLFNYGCSQQTLVKTDTLQYPKGYPETPQTVIQQLSSYPLPRYSPSHKLQHLFNWMDPYYMGGLGQKGATINVTVPNAVIIQKELINNWHYGIVLPNAGAAFNGPKVDGCPSLIRLANQYPNVPLHVITFWGSVNPKLIGKPYTRGTIVNQKLDSSLYISFDFYGNPKREISFGFPDSLVQIDGHTQKYNLEKIIKCLTRPINMINENGEEPPGPYQLDAIQKDEAMIALKKKMGIDSWEDFMALQKLRLRQTYASSFMKEVPELKETKFNFYAVEGGPVNCFEWHTMKKIQSPNNGLYYSTPDFYPRWPKNWKEWDGPWHGWSWIEAGRKKEIKDGDYLFSPFVAAGWSKVQEEDIRPGQWLGLLKCLGVVGAEFYYTGYFSLSPPFTDPAKWAWQAAMPAYAQAITSRYEDELRNGNVLFDKNGEPLITYGTSDKHVLVTVRKHRSKEKYIICGTYQPFTNEANELPEKKNIDIEIAGQNLSFEIRRQGSVYVYEKTNEGKVLFYQLDAWHENKHPDHWSKDFYFEAEVADTSLSNASLFTVDQKENDFTNYTTYISLDKHTTPVYNFIQRDSAVTLNYVWLRYKGEGNLSAVLSKDAKQWQQEEKMERADQWKWHRIKLSDATFSKNNKLLLNCKKGSIDLDKLVISAKDTEPKID